MNTQQTFSIEKHRNGNTLSHITSSLETETGSSNEVNLAFFEEISLVIQVENSNAVGQFVKCIFNSPDIINLYHLSPIVKAVNRIYLLSSQHCSGFWTLNQLKFGHCILNPPQFF